MTKYGLSRHGKRFANYSVGSLYSFPNVKSQLVIKVRHKLKIYNKKFNIRKIMWKNKIQAKRNIWKL